MKTREAGVGSTTNHVVDSVGGWDPNQWVDGAIRFTWGTKTPELRGVWAKITANTASEFTIAVPLAAAPVAGDTFEIRIFDGTLVPEMTHDADLTPSYIDAIAEIALHWARAETKLREVQHYIRLVIICLGISLIVQIVAFVLRARGLQ